MVNNQSINSTPFRAEHPPLASMKVRYLVLATSLIPLIIALIWLPQLPERIPGHWDMAGNVTRYGARGEALLTPITFLLLNLGLALGFRKRRLPENQKILVPLILAINLVSIVLTLIFLSQMGGAYVVAGGADGGAPLAQLAFPFFMCLLISASWIYTYPVFKGAAEGEPNYAIGFRTSATLANKESWQSGNILAARYLLFVSLGLTMLVLIAYGWLFFAGMHDAAIWWRVFNITFAVWVVAAMIVIAVVHRKLKAAQQHQE